jgi:CheY-like chemotaxis protein
MPDPCRVLVVEDEALVAMMLEDLLADLGCEVVDNPMRLDQAIAAAHGGEFDLALLDLNLAGRRTYEVADILTARGIPFAFLTGYRAEDLEPAYRETPILAKPFRRGDLEAILARLDNRQRA